MDSREDKEIRMKEFKLGYSPLMTSVATGNFDATVFILERGLGDIHERDLENNTILHVFATHRGLHHDDSMILSYLINKGADLTAVNNKEQTPEQLARAEGKKSMWRLLVSQRMALSSQGFFKRKRAETDDGCAKSRLIHRQKAS